MPLLPIILACTLATGCDKRLSDSEIALRQYATEQETQRSALTTAANKASHVLVVINTASQESLEIGAYYKAKRGISTANVVTISVSKNDNISKDEFKFGILEPVQKAVEKSKTRIDYIVTTKGVPLRIESDGGFSVDAFLMTIAKPMEPIKDLTEQEITRCVSPYFQKSEPFSSDKYHLYLVTRLDGYSIADCKALVDHSLAARPVKGPFFFDEADNAKTGGYVAPQQNMVLAHDALLKKGFDSQLETTVKFVAPALPLMGYCSWGSNDHAFDAQAYHNLQFLPGALAETFVSTSGRTFHPNDPGQSQIGDLVAQGVTGVKGYVSEPFTFSLVHPQILFDRYTSGFNLAESFYMASPILKYKDIVIGDPLCAPYPQK